jgi:hypothetical protein
MVTSGEVKGGTSGPLSLFGFSGIRGVGLPYNRSLNIANHDTPLGLKVVVTSMVKWSGGSRLVLVHIGITYRRTYGYMC